MKNFNRIDKPEFNLGDRVEVLLTKKDYEGKSVRRNIIDGILEEWRKNTFFTMQTYMDSRICKGTLKKDLKALKAIVKGEKACELSIFKRHEDSKAWMKSQINILDNIEGAVVIGVEGRFHHGSMICPFHCSYMDKVSFFKYRVMIYKKDGGCFEVELLSDNMQLVK